MEAYVTYLKGLHRKARVGGLVLVVIGVVLCIVARLAQGPDYSQVVVGGALFIAGTLLAALGEIANMLGGLAKAMSGQEAESDDHPT